MTEKQLYSLLYSINIGHPMLCRFHTTSRVHWQLWHGVIAYSGTAVIYLYVLWKDSRQLSRFNGSSFLMVLNIVYKLRTHLVLCRSHGYKSYAFIQWWVWEQHICCRVLNYLLFTIYVQLLTHYLWRRGIWYCLHEVKCENWQEIIVLMIYIITLEIISRIIYVKDQMTTDMFYLSLHTSRSFPHLWLITGCVTRLKRRMPLVEQYLLTLPKHLRSPPVFSGIRVIQSIVFV
jgi:hypothetical protein